MVSMTVHTQNVHLAAKKNQPVEWKMVLSVRPSSSPPSGTCVSVCRVVAVVVVLPGEKKPYSSHSLFSGVYLLELEVLKRSHCQRIRAATTLNGAQCSVAPSPHLSFAT